MQMMDVRYSQLIRTIGGELTQRKLCLGDVEPRNGLIFQSGYLQGQYTDGLDEAEGLFEARGGSREAV